MEKYRDVNAIELDDKRVVEMKVTLSWLAMGSCDLGKKESERDGESWEGRKWNL